MNTIKKIKTIRGYTNLARFHDDISEDLIGEIPRPINEPYVQSQTVGVWDWNGTPIIITEASHLYYVIYEVSGPINAIPEEVV